MAWKKWKKETKSIYILLHLSLIIHYLSLITYHSPLITHHASRITSWDAKAVWSFSTYLFIGIKYAVWLCCIISFFGSSALTSNLWAPPYSFYFLVCFIVSSFWFCCIWCLLELNTLCDCVCHARLRWPLPPHDRRERGMAKEKCRGSCRCSDVLRWGGSVWECVCVYVWAVDEEIILDENIIFH